jgi:hypothetical protein
MNGFTAKSLFRLKPPAGFSIFQQQKNFIRPTLALSSPNNIYSPKYLSKSRIIIGSQQRFYSAEGGLSRQNIESRIIDIVKSFDKVDPIKVFLNFIKTHLIK